MDSGTSRPVQPSPSWLIRRGITVVGSAVPRWR